MQTGGFSLYKKKWSATDREAQYQNMVDMFSDLSSPENIYQDIIGETNSFSNYSAIDEKSNISIGNIDVSFCQLISYGYFDGSAHC